MAIGCIVTALGLSHLGYELAGTTGQMIAIPFAIASGYVWGKLGATIAFHFEKE